MASFLSRILSRIAGNQQASKSSRSSRKRNRRRLRMEAMEARRLLAGDIASISGNVFTDLLDDGTLNGSDPGLVGVDVNLYRDGGNGTFESNAGTAGGDDVFIGTSTTGAAGDYAFSDLVAGTYFVEQEAATGQLQRAGVSPRTVTISESQASGVLATNIDTFETTTQSLTANSGTPTSSSSAATAANETIGDERDLVVNHLSGANNVSVNVSGGLLSISTDAATTGNAIITYDGADGDANTIDHTTLGGVDLTAGSAEAFHFLVGSEAGNTMTLDVFSTAANYSSVTVNLPVTAGAAATENLIVDFASLTTTAGTGVDFSNVTAIRLQVDMAAATDAQIELTQTVAPFVQTEQFANLNPMSVGNLVFNDVDNNGVFDGSDAGISGVTVELYEDTNANNSFDSGTDTLVATTTTDGTGNYVFDNLLPGEYIALIPIAQFNNGSPLFGFQTSTGNDPTPDPDTTVTDGDDNGALIAGVGVASNAITLASGTEPTNDGDADTNTNFTLDFGFAPTVDLSVVKTATSPTVIAGNQVEYTLTITNAGDATSTNVVVTDDVPDNFTNLSAVASNGGVVSTAGPTTGEITVTYPQLTPGQTETITITATIPAAEAAATGVRNTASITGDGVETDASNNTSFADIDITRQAVLTIAKTDTPDPVVVGGQLTYEILVTNTGASTATNVVVTDSLPTGLTFVSASSTSGSAVENAGVVTTSIPSMTVSEAVTVTIVTTVDSAFAGTTISNTATAQADEAATVQSQADTTVNPQVDLSIVKNDDVDPANRGGTINYELVVTNSGPSAASNVEIVDTLPADVTFVSASGGTVTPPSGGNQEVVVNVGALAASATATVTVTVTANNDAPASVTNTALVRSTESIAGFDTDTTNNSTTEDTALQSLVDLSIVKTDLDDPVAPGNNLRYEIVVTNLGPSTAPLVRVTDDLPDGIRIISATSTAGTVTVPASAQDTIAANNDDLIVDVGSLLLNGTATINITAEVLPDSRGTLTNVATVASTDTSVVESDTTNNSSQVDTTLTPSVDLVVTKVDGTDPATAGQQLTYTINVSNTGASTATNVTLTDTLPTGVTFSSASPSQGTVTNNNGVLTGDLGTLAPNGSASIVVVVDVDASTRGNIDNTASVTSTETDADTTNNSATAQTTINGSVDLSVTKTDNLSIVAAGDSLTYTMVVTNNGPSDATTVVLTDTLPSSLTVTSVTTNVGTATNNGNAVTADIGTLAPSATATVTVVATVDSAATGTISNTASVDSSETEINTADNSATDTTDVAQLASISGQVFIDANQNQVFDTGDTALPNVAIALSGTDISGNPVSANTTTDASGNYTFDNLVPGTYTITETQPLGVADGESTVGSGATGVAGTNQITTIDLGSGVNATAFNFTELQTEFSKRRFLASSV